MARRSFALVLAAVLLVLGACAGDGDERAESDGQDDTTGATHVAVTISDQGCNPPDITVVEGKIAFDVSNDGSSSVTEFHVVDSDGGDIGAVTDVMRGQEETLTLELPEGEYVIRCPNGETEEGTLTVTTGGPDGGPGGGGGNPNETPVGGEGGTESRLDDRRNGDTGTGGDSGGEDGTPQGGG